MDVTTATFEQEVIEASKTVPVVADFWAPWCGPCRALGPIIEKVVGELGGSVKLVKINSDDNPELSQAFGIRSIPTVIAFKDGQIASHFLGALPEPQVRQFVSQLVPPEPEAELEIEVEVDAPGLDESPDVEDPAEDELRARLTADASDHDARLALADRYAAQLRYADAMEQLLEIVRRDKGWRDDEARKQLLALFDRAAAQPDLVATYRRKLASTLH